MPIKREIKANSYIVGLSLIELMISMTMAIFLLSGVVYIVQTNTATQLAASQYAHLQDSGRSALSTIVDSHRRAGYLGIYSVKGPVTSLVTGQTPLSNKCGTTTDQSNKWALMMQQPIFGVNQDDSTTKYDCIKSQAGTPYLGKYQSDILVVRHADYEQVSPDIEGINYLGTSLSRAFAFTYDGAIPSNVDFGSERPTAFNKVVSIAYFIGKSGETCNGKEIPSLYRYTHNETGEPTFEELILGVERLQVSYLVKDSNVKYQYRRPDQVSLYDWEKVKLVKIWLLARATCMDASVDDTAEYKLGDIIYKPNDHYRRRLFTTSVAVRNKLK